MTGPSPLRPAVEARRLVHAIFDYTDAMFSRIGHRADESPRERLGREIDLIFDVRGGVLVYRVEAEASLALAISRARWLWSLDCGKLRRESDR